MNGHILIIEDNPQNLYMMRFLLEKNGCTVIAAKSGPEGIEKARKHRPRLILLDIQLPGMDGYDVAEALKNHPKTLDLPIIAVTSYAMAGDKEKILAAGADGYMEKPIDPETFIGDIEEYLSRGAQ